MTEGRDKTGKWLPGTSGNPSGQPANVRIIRELLEPHREALVAKAVALALAGDVTALRTCLERLAPPPRAEAPATVVSGLAEAQTLTEKAGAVISAVGSGEISPDTGERILQALASFAKVKEADELEKRIAELEARDLV